MWTKMDLSMSRRWGRRRLKKTTMRSEPIKCEPGERVELKLEFELIVEFVIM